MYAIEDIRHLRLELSGRCNARCPLCPRNFYGYPYNDGYVEHDMTLSEIQTIFNIEFVQQLDEILVNGNFGDIVMNPETIDIISWFRSINPEVLIKVSTNGGARDAEFWTALAKTRAMVMFSIDGLGDTHSLYRQNTCWDIVIKNAKTFIQAGGYAIWKFIKFDHTQHQIAECKQMAQELGFKEFSVCYDGRDQGPVFNNHGELVYVMGSPKTVNFDQLFKSRTQDEVLLEDIVVDRQPCEINCQAKEKKSIYVSAIGEVYPCCWMGFNPRTYGHGTYYQAVNQQICDIIGENNALEHDLADCINWFNKVEESWKIPKFDYGRLVICNDVCGKR